MNCCTAGTYGSQKSTPRESVSRYSQSGNLKPESMFVGVSTIEEKKPRDNC
eukprot:m.287746 g.287746  ORF g.287746 m.287746 type:complete len:51 (-) comp198368_c0_seq1:263-415(-)